MSMGWTASDVLEELGKDAVFTGPKSSLGNEVSAVKIDSRTLNDGDCFIAIRGENNDAHRFIESIPQNVNVLCVVESAWFNANGAQFKHAFILVENTLEALHTLARSYKNRIGSDIIGITGTNGKTTTKELVAHVLESTYATSKTAGNLNNHFGVPLTLLALRSPVQKSIIEMGTNHPGEIAGLCKIAEPQSGLITNIGKGHTEFLGDLDGVRRAKRELFEAIAARQGVAFVNTDDHNVLRAAKESGLRDTISYGFQGSPDVSGKNMRLGADGCPEFECRGKNIKIAVPGMHNAINGLAAIAVGLHNGIPMVHMQDALRKPLAVKGRMDITRFEGRTIIDDTYNANPESMRVAIDCLYALPGIGRRFLALADMHELGDNAHAEHIEILAHARQSLPELILLRGPLMRQAASSFSEDSSLMVMETQEEIAEVLATQMKSEDALLVKGSRGQHMEKVIFFLKKIMRAGKNN